MKKAKVFVLFVLGLLPVFPANLAGAATGDEGLTIKVIQAEVVPLKGTRRDVVGDCYFNTYSAYCQNSANQSVQNRMVVETSDGRLLGLACTVDKQSNCALLPSGENFKAEVEKLGLVIYYPDSSGKEQKQLYDIISSLPKTALTEETDAEVHKSSTTSVAAAPVATNQEESSPADVITAIRRHRSAKATSKIWCTLTSTPPGAKITLDGAYVGDTPTAIGVNSGAHELEMSLPGFAHWNRLVDLSSGSEVSVNATMQKVVQ
jgi:hypothetical protein